MYLCVLFLFFVGEVEVLLGGEVETHGHTHTHTHTHTHVPLNDLVLERVTSKTEFVPRCRGMSFPKDTPSESRPEIEIELTLGSES